MKVALTGCGVLFAVGSDSVALNLLVVLSTPEAQEHCMAASTA
jgi:hypothetical protein